MQKQTCNIIDLTSDERDSESNVQAKQSKRVKRKRATDSIRIVNGKPMLVINCESSSDEESNSKRLKINGNSKEEAVLISDDTCKQNNSNENQDSNSMNNKGNKMILPVITSTSTLKDLLKEKNVAKRKKTLLKSVSSSKVSTSNNLPSTSEQKSPKRIPSNLEDSNSESERNKTELNNQAIEEENEISEEFSNFLDLAVKNVKEEQRKGIKEMNKTISLYYKRLGKKYTECEDWKNELDEAIKKINANPRMTIFLYKKIYETLQEAANRITPMQSSRVHIKKLEKILEKVKKKIIKYEEKEIDFDNENDDTYERMQRYRKRAADIYTKICSLQKLNPYENRTLYKKIDFHGSKYTELNKAINKIVRNSAKFVEYDLFKRKILKYFKEHNIENPLKNKALFEMEVKHCFEEVGKKQQRFRGLDLYQVHESLIPADSMDPYESNVALREELSSNHEKMKKAMNEVLQKYADIEAEQKNAPEGED